MNLEEFCKHWPLAVKQGWKLLPTSKNIFYVMPPHNSKPGQDQWAATYTQVDLGGIELLIPHWFVSTVTNTKH